MEHWLSDDQAKAICWHRAKSNEYIRRKLISGTKVPRETWMKWAHEYDAVHTILKSLAGICDGAKSHDGCGFNKLDSGLGKRLANRAQLTNDEFWQGVRMARKYHRQVDPALMAWVPLMCHESARPGTRI